MSTPMTIWTCSLCSAPEPFPEGIDPNFDGEVCDFCGNLKWEAQ